MLLYTILLCYILLLYYDIISPRIGKRALGESFYFFKKQESASRVPMRWALCQSGTGGEEMGVGPL